MVSELETPVSLTSNEEAQLSQTIEMFEVITESQPLDYQSLEILKEAYSKLGRAEDSTRTSKRIAEAYLSLGQLSSAILEYEGILQQFPDDPDVRQALNEIESKARNLAAPKSSLEPPNAAVPSGAASKKKPDRRFRTGPVDDGRQTMQKIFVEGKFMSLSDFDLHWPVADLNEDPDRPGTPFLQVLADNQFVPIETALKLVMDRSRLRYLAVERYEVDVDLARGFPRDVCQRWCILPFDRMSTSVLLATANPFNNEAVKELEECIQSRLLWYLASPAELVKSLQKVFR